MIRIAIEITCNGSSGNAIEFETSSGKILQSTSRWIFPNIWRYQSLELKTMVGNFTPDQLDMSTSVLRWIIRDLIKNTRFLLQTLIRTTRFEISVESAQDLPLKIVSQDTNGRIWVSRHSLWVGIKPTDLEGTLEEERLKNPLQFTAMVRSVDLISDSSEFLYETHESNGFTLQNFEESDSRNYRFFVEAEKVTDAEIFHARVVVVNNQILQMSNRRTALLPRSPAFIDEIEGKYHPFKLFLPQLCLESGLYIGTATNWFHFIVELAVRIGGVPKESYLGKPIVIEMGAHKNILRLCYLMTGVEPIQVAVGQSIRVSQLTILREFGVKDPIDPVQRTLNLNEFARIISENVASSKERISSKLFFRRKPHLYRPLQNEKEVAAFLESKGFQSVYPEEYPLDDFISIIRDADYVIAESGAAITNMMFAKPSTKFLEITPALVTSEFWRSFIEVFEQDYFGIQGRVARIGAKGYAYDGYKISLDGLRSVLASWGIY